MLCLIKGLGRGGAELLLTAQVFGRDRNGLRYEVAYLLPQKDALVAHLEADRVPVTCLGSRRTVDPTWMLRLRRLIVEHQIDVIHAHSPVAAAGARLVLRTLPKRNRPKMVTTEHNVWQSHTRLTRVFDRVTASGDDAHLAVSSAVRASLPTKLRTRTEVIRHGVDVDAIAATLVERDAVRRELGLDDQLVVGTVANLRVTKGWPDLLAAAKKVIETVDNVTFVGVGQGPMEQEIRRLHRHLGLGDRFRLLGFRPDAVRIMAGCDIFCLASHHEGFPVAIMEAMALGLPIVATDVGGVGELVLDRVHGRVVPPHEPDRLAAALLELLTNEDRRVAAIAAVTSKAEDLSADRAIERVESVYRVLAAR